MIELPEAVTLASQLNESVQGKRIADVVAAQSPHKFAWFHGDPRGYAALLSGKTFGRAESHGGLVAIQVEDARLLFGDGVALRVHTRVEDRPRRHQLLIVFEDSVALSGSVQMYGGLWAFGEGTFDSKYYQRAQEAPSPLSRRFSQEYFSRMATAPEVQKLSVKALLATEQRIPGLGNGVLQDILYEACLHPKRKVATLAPADRTALFHAVKTTLAKMCRQGGRETEKDLYGQWGQYRTKASKNTLDTSCSRCGGTIVKEAYLGGTVYYCASCQK